MSNSARKYLIAGNWKMNLNSAEGAELAKDVVIALYFLRVTNELEDTAPCWAN